MPAFNADYFGSANVGKIYGLIIIAWGFGGMLGPLLISRVVDATGAYANAMYILAGLMIVGTIVPLIIRPPRGPASPPEEQRHEHKQQSYSPLLDIAANEG